MRSDYKELNCSKVILITGAAGFIGFHLARRLLLDGLTVIGFDNLNAYYDVKLKNDRLKILEAYKTFQFIKGDLANKEALEALFKSVNIDIVVNLAAQAGVRYSIENPDAYIQSNIVGFFNILECCRYYPVDHLIYASSSSVYGCNDKVPFSTEDKVDMPVSLYAATKKSNELMAYSYCKLYNIKATGLRFFTVYGPMGRPDMAYFSFSEKIIRNQPIKIFNNGNMYRDFTYIDDIVEGIVRILANSPVLDRNQVGHKVYNIGNNKPEKLMLFVEILEKELGKEAIKEFCPMQPGDVYQTYADVSELERDFNFRPRTTLEEGINIFIEWFLKYYNW
ncbi:UDP-glucuronate 4-epimerase [Lachnotalea glycerini]|uniref:SDR family NAD(P)-dependent oxidoreductase n=1 Tax=Lachnotalea glycerini TaxID=1763509 RepID=A0A318EPE4_9FIRM|nr:SDR family NAD(P)-dependent oxidoreductase [Lachnotalea glycerini]PXV87250.1 UDP-glucuronate 4-epimerase [Lachnotalea glycerini]RDY31702.1 SDR family NAD(P)-dependent oxidoreductase [Lachnotalea glycerini]